MDIKQEIRGHLVILSLTGRLDTLTFPVLDNEMTSLLKNKQENIILDCLEMDYVSSSGLRVMLKSLKQVKAAGGRLVLCSLQAPIRQVFKISGFDHLFEIYPEQTGAIASFN
jgi:anti-anti-sigma factor